MGLTSSGPICDVCGKYILLDTLHEFKVTGIKGTLICHTECKTALVDCQGDWRKLPEGRLRQAFEDADAAEVAQIEEDAAFADECERDKVASLQQTDMW